MSRLQIRPTGVERTFSDDEIIVSKTDTHGKITYVNDVFVHVSQYERTELVGQPHSMVRHPDMPRSVFQLLWDTIQEGREVFAYIVNLCRTGDHYWVFAHVTPTFDVTGRIIGYHSNRRTVPRAVLPTIEALYAELRRAESGSGSKRDAVAAGLARLNLILEEQGRTYDEHVWSL